jgi:hypothetical protein
MWFFVKPEVEKTYIEPDVYAKLLEKNPTENWLHTIAYTSKTLPKRIILKDAGDQNPYHLFFYMLARFYYVDDGHSPIYFYYNETPNKYLTQAVFDLLPKRFIRETQKLPGYEYVDLPGCCWLVDVIDETWIYPYVRDLFKEHWENIPQIKGKRTYISRNLRECHARRCLNEDKLVLPLKKLGFSMHTMEHLTFLEQIRLFRSSEFITGVHGAGFAWILFCHPGTVIFEIGRPDFYTKQHHYTQIAVTLNLKHYALVEEESIPSRIEYPTQLNDDIVIPLEKYRVCLQHIVQKELAV